MLEVKFKKLDSRAVIPFKANPGDAGLDLVAVESKTIFSGKYEKVLTGLAVELPKGHEGQVRSRSGLASKYGIAVLNSPGTIDEGYRGEIGVILINHGDKPYTVNIGDKIAQLVIAPVPEIQVLEVTELSDSVRGEGGFGSSGVSIESEILIKWEEPEVEFDNTVTRASSELPYDVKAKLITSDSFRGFELSIFSNHASSYSYKDFFSVRFLSNAKRLTEVKIIEFIDKIKADENKKSLRDNILNNCQEQVKSLIEWSEPEVYYHHVVHKNKNKLPCNSEIVITSLDECRPTNVFINCKDIKYSIETNLKALTSVKVKEETEKLFLQILKDYKVQVYPESQDKPTKEELFTKLGLWIATFTEIPSKLEGKIKDPYDVFEVAEKFVKELSIHIDKYHEIIKGAK